MALRKNNQSDYNKFSKTDEDVLGNMKTDNNKKEDRQQRKGQRKVDRATKKGKLLNIAVESDDQELYGNFKLDPKGVTVAKGGHVADTDDNFSLTDEGIVKMGDHNYSKSIPEVYKLHANQDLVGPIGKKVNFKKRHKQ